MEKNLNMNKLKNFLEICISIQHEVIHRLFRGNSAFEQQKRKFLLRLLHLIKND